MTGPGASDPGWGQLTLAFPELSKAQQPRSHTVLWPRSAPWECWLRRTQLGPSHAQVGGRAGLRDRASTPHCGLSLEHFIPEPE